ncbi:MAG TPA: Hsp33 family molecular chaperone [Caulobacteraceae bacterium]|jgi:molecular chaperone Hsp33
MSHIPPAMARTDDLVAPFQIETQPVRGRVARLGAAIDEVLTRHAYPEAVANLLGEACVLAALVGSGLKFEGRLLVQAQGDGPVSLLVADYDAATGGLRGYGRFDAERVAAASQGFVRPGAGALLGHGAFVMTLDQGPDMDRYQGVTPIEGETLALAAETYFSQSEQTPTRVRLAVGTAPDPIAGHPVWRAGGLMIQNIAEDEARGSTAEAWTTAQALFETLGEDELTDPQLPAQRLLWRLFHEEGVRMFTPKPVKAFCRCSRERIAEVLASFAPAERAAMVAEDGRIRVTCEYCARDYVFTPEDAG